jgi:molybdate transport system substrate-binding protein
MRSTARARRAAPLLAAILLVQVRPAYADEIIVMTSGAFTAAYLELAPRFAASTKHTVITATTSMGTGTDSIPSRLQRGDPVDVVILPAEVLDLLIESGRVVAGSRVDLARSSIGMAVRAGARKPDISTLDALRRALLDAKSVAYSSSVSGDYLVQELFPRLGIAEQLARTGRRIERERVGAVVARGEAEIGFQQMSELLPVAGIDVVGPLPPQVQRVTVIAAGVASHSRRQDASRALIRFLASPEAASVVLKTGMELVTPR